jgi:hypothetical protein
MAGMLGRLLIISAVRDFARRIGATGERTGFATRILPNTLDAPRRRGAPGANGGSTGHRSPGVPGTAHTSSQHDHTCWREEHEGADHYGPTEDIVCRDRTDRVFS